MMAEPIRISGRVLYLLLMSLMDKEDNDNDNDEVFYSTLIIHLKFNTAIDVFAY